MGPWAAEQRHLVSLSSLRKLDAVPWLEGMTHKDGTAGRALLPALGGTVLRVYPYFFFQESLSKTALMYLRGRHPKGGVQQAWGYRVYLVFAEGENGGRHCSRRPGWCSCKCPHISSACQWAVPAELCAQSDDLPV